MTGTCIIADPGSEVPTGTCVYQECDGGVECSIDSTCSVADASTVYPPYVPLYAPDVPSTCANGFEICDAEGAPVYTIKAVPKAGSRALTLDLDFATYLAPDGLLITGIDGNCKNYVLFDSCRLQTADEAEGSYTNGMARPTDTAIRQFHLTLRPGTSQLTFNFANVQSPMYFQILGLCDFAITTVPGVGWFNLVLLGQRPSAVDDVDGVPQRRGARLHQGPRRGWGEVVDGGGRRPPGRRPSPAPARPSPIIVLASGPTMWTPRICLVFFVGDDLHEALGLVERHGLAQGGEGELADDDLDAARLGLLGGEAGAGDLGIGEDGAGDGHPVLLGLVAGDHLGDDLALLGGLVGDGAGRR